MPQSPPLPDCHSPTTSRGTGTMSLTILPPAPTTCRQQSLQTPLTPASATLGKPKLSLNTANLTSLVGKKATSLRLETLSATSPTARNTFRNGQEQDSSSRPRRPALTPLATTTTITPQRSIDTSTPSQIELPDSAESTDVSTCSSSAVSTTSVSTVDSLPPYKLPFNVTSILSNSPIPRASKRRLSISQPGHFFPAPKRVAFRAPLTEEIKNEKYTLRNSDVESAPSTPLDVSHEQTEEAVVEAPVETVTASSPASNKRMSPVDEEEDSDTCPATPVAGRRKRHRQWVWTLGPVEATEQGEHPQEVGTSEDKVEAGHQT